MLLGMASRALHCRDEHEAGELKLNRMGTTRAAASKGQEEGVYRGCSPELQQTRQKEKWQTTVVHVQGR